MNQMYRAGKQIMSAVWDEAHVMEPPPLPANVSAEDAAAARALLAEVDPLLNAASVQLMRKMLAVMKETMKANDAPQPKAVIMHPTTYKQLVQGDFNA